MQNKSVALEATKRFINSFLIIDIIANDIVLWCLSLWFGFVLKIITILHGFVRHSSLLAIAW